MISSISRLQDKSSEVVESNIQSNLRGLLLSNTTAIYDSSSIRKSFSQSPESNQTSSQRGSIVFMGNNNTQKIMRSAIATVRRVSLEVIILCVLLSPMKKLNLFENLFGLSQDIG